MFTAKNKYIWFVNLILFIGIVFMGIEQAGKGAEIAKLENDLEKTTVSKQKLTDVIFTSNKNLDSNEYFLSLGFIKPTTVYYFNTENFFASLLK